MKSYLITGGAGFFGRAFVKRLLETNASERICIFSRGEHSQAAFRQELNDDPRCRWFIGDVRDQARLKRAMHGVDVVIHAAALKRIEVGAYDAEEMVKTNVLGTIAVVEAARDAGVKKVVYLSSDKAHSPVSSYGLSKALAEAIVLQANNSSGGTIQFSACRYGNIWNASGSILPKWRGLLESGARSVPTTSADCTRFFMKISEAVDLVLDTITTMPRDVVIPKLPAYRVGDLAIAMGAQMDIRGLPAWEKAHESMEDGNSSDRARRMTIREIQRELREVGFEPLLEAAE